MATIIDIVSGYDVCMHTCHGNYPSKSKLALWKSLFHCNSYLKSCNEVTWRSASVIKVGVVDVSVHISSHVKEEMTWAVDKQTALDYK